MSNGAKQCERKIETFSQEKVPERWHTSFPENCAYSLMRECLCGLWIVGECDEYKSANNIIIHYCRKHPIAFRHQLGRFRAQYAIYDAHPLWHKWPAKARSGRASQEFGTIHCKALSRKLSCSCVCCQWWKWCSLSNTFWVFIIFFCFPFLTYF